MLEAQHRRKVNKRQGFAELGMRMANAAQTFSESLDPDNNEYVEAEDIVRVLAKVASKDFTYRKMVDGKWTDAPFDAEKVCTRR